MRKILLAMLILGICGIMALTEGNSTLGLALIAFAYYLFTVLTVLGIRRALRLLSYEE